MWLKIKAIAAFCGAALAVIAGAFLWGRSTGKAGAKAVQAAAEAKAIQEARVIEDDVQAADGGAIDARLAQWMRDKR